MISVFNRKWLPSDTLTALLSFVLFITLVGDALWMSRQRADLSTARANVAALTDTIRVQKNRTGQTESARLVLVADLKSLRSLNDSLALELQKEKGRIAYLAKIGVRITSDTVRIPAELTIQDSGDTEGIDGVYGLVWRHHRDTAGGSREIIGESKFEVRGDTIIPGETAITTDLLTINLVTGLRRNDKKQIEIWVRSEYPGFSVDRLDGAVVDPSAIAPKKRREWFVLGPGAWIGYGPGGLQVGGGIAGVVRVVGF